MATLHPRFTSHYNYPLRPQEPYLLPRGKEAHTTTSQVVPVSVRVRHQIGTHPGNKMILSDALSRRPDFCPDEDHDNEDVVMLPDHMFLQLIDLDLQQKIAP